MTYLATVIKYCNLNLRMLRLQNKIDNNMMFEVAQLPKYYYGQIGLQLFLCNFLKGCKI